MKPGLFHVGQAVVCVKPDPAPGPVIRVGTVYSVRAVEKDLGRKGRWYLALDEFPETLTEDWYWSENHFAPVELLPDEALAELLAETLEPVTA